MVEVLRLKGAVDVLDLALGNTVGDFVIEPRAGADDGDVGIGVEGMEDAAGGDLDSILTVRFNRRFYGGLSSRGDGFLPRRLRSLGHSSA